MSNKKQKVDGTEIFLIWQRWRKVKKSERSTSIRLFFTFMFKIRGRQGSSGSSASAFPAGLSQARGYSLHPQFLAEELTLAQPGK